jgi:hypothetical protein
MSFIVLIDNSAGATAVAASRRLLLRALVFLLRLPAGSAVRTTLCSTLTLPLSLLLHLLLGAGRCREHWCACWFHAGSAGVRVLFVLRFLCLLITLLLLPLLLLLLRAGCC